MGGQVSVSLLRKLMLQTQVVNVVVLVSGLLVLPLIFVESDAILYLLEQHLLFLSIGFSLQLVLVKQPFISLFNSVIQVLLVAQV